MCWLNVLAFPFLSSPHSCSQPRITMRTPNKQQHVEGGEQSPRESGDVEPSPIFVEEVVEMIIARMPFPSLFKARLLSNAWNRKFTRPREDSLSNALTPFQKEVTSVSHKWPSYCPVFVSSNGVRGFDRASFQWKTLFGPCKFVHPFNYLFNFSHYRFAGSLMFAPFSACVPLDTNIMNVITGSSIMLELPCIQHRSPMVATSCPGDSNTSYRVVQIHSIRNFELGRNELHTTVYDSKVGDWSGVTKSTLSDLPDFVGDIDHPLGSNVYLHGKLYCLCKGTKLGTDMLLLCVNLVDSDKTWSSFHLSFSDVHDRARDVHDHIASASILLCGETVMVVSLMRSWDVFIFELNLDTLGYWSLVEMHRIAPIVESSFEVYWMEFASGDDVIYIGKPYSQNAVISYNTHNGEWGTLPHPYYREGSVEDTYTVMLSSAFTPGLNPFAIVEKRGARPQVCP